MASLFLIRHGQASFGAANYDSLSPLGERQCRLLGEWWKARTWQAEGVVSGPMVRHQQSMNAFLAGFGAEREHQVLPELAEFDHENVLRVYRPEFADMGEIAKFLASSPNPRKAFQQTFTEAVERWHDGRYDHEYNESWPVFKQRVLDAFAHLQREGQDRLVFTSGGVISVMLQAVLNIRDSKSFALNAVIANSSYSRVLFKGDEVSMSVFNNIAHLDVHNAPELITYR